MASCKSPAATVKRLKPIMPGAGTEARFGKLCVCEALPSAERGKNKAKLTTTALP